MEAWITKLQFFIKKNFIKLYIFSSSFGHQNPGSASGSALCWIRIRIETILDPKHALINTVPVVS
jgi:hypothetical protein